MTAAALLGPTDRDRQRRWRGPSFYRHAPGCWDRSLARKWLPHEVDMVRRLLASEHELGDRAAAQLQRPS